MAKEVGDFVCCTNRRSVVCKSSRSVTSFTASDCARATALLMKLLQNLAEPTGAPNTRKPSYFLWDGGAGVIFLGGVRCDGPFQC